MINEKNTFSSILLERIFFAAKRVPAIFPLKPVYNFNKIYVGKTQIKYYQSI